jgi:hypothetical protein
MVKRIIRLPDGNWIAIPVPKNNQGQYMIKIFTAKEFVDFYMAMPKRDWIDWGQDLIIVDSNTIIARWYADDDDQNNINNIEGNSGIQKGDIPFGIYKAEFSRWGVKLCPMSISQDKYIDLLSETTRDLLDDIETFTAAMSRYKDLNLLINHVVEKYKDIAHVIFIDDEEIFLRNFHDFKEILQDKLTIFVIEEITNFLHPRGDDMPRLDAMPQILTFLDGQDSWDNMLMLATTNFPERIPVNLIDRPSRFDRILRIDQPSKDVRRKYLENVLDNGMVTDDILEKTNGMSIAHLKEICVQVRIQKKPILAVIKELEDRKAEIGKYFINGIGNGNSSAFFT